MKNIIRTTILFVIIILSGCFCQDTKPYLRVENMELYLRKLTEEYQAYGGGLYSEKFDADSSSIAHDSLLLKIKSTGTYYASNSFGNLFISSAYAIKCAEDGSEGTKEQISDISIWSDSLFFPDGNVGENLAQYFNVRGYIGRKYVASVDLVSFLSTQPFSMTELYLGLKKNPTASKKHKFTIIYKQTNGKEFHLTTPEIEFE